MNTNEHEFINDEARMSNDEKRSPRITRIDAKEKPRKRKSFALLRVIRGQAWSLCFIGVHSCLLVVKSQISAFRSWPRFRCARCPLRNLMPQLDLVGPKPSAMQQMELARFFGAKG